MLSQSMRYYLPEPSHWPIVGSCGLFLMTLGGVLWMNQIGAGPWVVLAGMAVMGGPHAFFQAANKLLMDSAEKVVLWAQSPW